MFDITCLDKYGNTVTYFTQWDLNQTLYIEEHGFTTAPQFHFCNKNSEKALVVQSILSDKDVLEVVVPNILLIEPYTITVYVYLSEEDSSKTVEYIQIPVRQRPQPNSFEYEDNVDIINVIELADEIRELNASISATEEERVSAENIRISNENTRIYNENIRKEEESFRATAETARVNAENTRESNESSRKSNEETRETAETARITDEATRQNNENTRKSNETTRQTTESNRVSAEVERVNAENNRITAENTRESAEALRVEAESERVEAETVRITAENARVSSEATRQTQETARQTNTATAISNAEKATDRANVAAEACEGIIEGTGLIPSAEKGAVNGVATLDENALIPVGQLPDINAKTLDGHGAEYFAHSADLANYLPLTGGRLSNAKRDVLQIENTSEGASVVDIRFMLNGVAKGQVGVASDGTLVFYDNAKQTSYIILHTGNKPTGTYTGNGDATRRDINIGAGIGDTLLIRSVNGFAIVYDGGVAFPIEGGNNVYPMNGGEVGFDVNSRTLYMLTTNVCLNAVGVEYKWYVL